MNYNRTLLVALAAIAIIMTISCKKKDDPAPSRTSLLTGKNWYYKSIVENNQDITSLVLDSCQRDDYETFKTDGTCTITDAGVKCNYGDSYGRWSFMDNDSKFLTDGDTCTINVLNSTTFTYTNPGNGGSTVVTMTTK